MSRISTLQIVSVVNLSVTTHALTIAADFLMSTALPGLSPAHRGVFYQLEDKENVSGRAGVENIDLTDCKCCELVRDDTRTHRHG